MVDKPEPEAKMVIGVTRAQQVEIEEHCIRTGLDFGQYFLGLHEEDKRKRLMREALANSPTEDHSVGVEPTVAGECCEDKSKSKRKK
jgi:hypothetical protein